MRPVPRTEQHGRLARLVSAAVAATALGVVLLAAGGAAAREQNSSTRETPQASGMVGVDTCVTCHEREGQSYRASAHARAWDPRTPAAARGCETCHGPGQGHVDDPGDRSRIRSFLRMAPREVSDTCTTCHNREAHAQWQGSMHDARNLTCTTCHSMHSPRSERAQLKQVSVLATCGQCHRDKLAKVERTAHMPVREGKMDCSTCHNQHGSTNVRLLRVGQSVNEFCVSCHTEKRGPFLWEHPPVRESCVTCHDPHGSSNDRMLVAKLPMLCQRCHIATRHPSTIYDAVAVAAKSNRVISRSCVTCHSNVHGSNHPSGMFFQR